MATKSTTGRITPLYFRPDVEGMRAIAAVAILLFHVDADSLPGGFIGVDLFFVISGYLITASICREVSAGSFSLVTFYARRIRRLYPALLVTVLLIFVAGFFLLFPRELRRLAEGAVATVFYVSNFYFAGHTDYFAHSQVRPFLHTWSLSVEEQFYLLYPALLLLVLKDGGRDGRKRLATALLLLAIASFGLAELLIRINPTLAFYLSPTRFWELAAGGLIAILPAAAVPRWWREAASLLGLGAMAAALLFYSDSTAVPGLPALLPVLGIALLIKAGEAPTFAARMLSAAPMLFLGRISYALYLVHWPLIVLLDANELDAPPQAVKLFVILASIGLAWLLHRFVEVPAQRISIVGNRRRIFAFAGAGSAALISLSALILLGGGFRERVPERSRQMIAYLDYDARGVYRSGSCLMDSRSERAGDSFDMARCIGPMSPSAPRVLLIGDSHAAQYYSALRDSFPHIQLAQITATGCRPLLKPVGAERCAELMHTAFHRLIGRRLFDTIIVAGRWRGEDLDDLPETAAFLAAHASQVYVIGPIIEYRMALPRLLAFSYLDGKLEEPDGDDSVDEARRMDRARRLDARMLGLLRPLSARVTYVSVVDALCHGDDCATMTPSGAPIQFDYGHLTYAGALQLVETLGRRGDFPVRAFGHMAVHDARAAARSRAAL